MTICNGGYWTSWLPSYSDTIQMLLRIGTVAAVGGIATSAAATTTYDTNNIYGTFFADHRTGLIINQNDNHGIVVIVLIGRMSSVHWVTCVCLARGTKRCHGSTVYSLTSKTCQWLLIITDDASILIIYGFGIFRLQDHFMLVVSLNGGDNFTIFIKLTWLSYYIFPSVLRGQIGNFGYICMMCVVIWMWGFFIVYVCVCVIYKISIFLLKRVVFLFREEKRKIVILC